MARAFAKFWASKATVTTVQQVYPHLLSAASTVAGAVAGAIAVPLTVVSAMDYIDNPWSVLVTRANGAGAKGTKKYLRLPPHFYFLLRIDRHAQT